MAPKSGKKNASKNAKKSVTGRNKNHVVGTTSAPTPAAAPTITFDDETRIAMKAMMKDLIAEQLQAAGANRAEIQMNQVEIERGSEERSMMLDKGSMFNKFLKANPPSFIGLNDTGCAEEWLHSMEKIFKRLGCSDSEKVSLATYTFRGLAENWWRTLERQYEGRGNELTWNKFLELFNSKYYPLVVRQQKQLDFLQLKQGNLTVADYEAKFTELSQFALHQIAREEDKVVMFMRGLEEDIHDKVVLLAPNTYADAFDKATRAEKALRRKRSSVEISNKRPREHHSWDKNNGGGNFNKRIEMFKKPGGDVGPSKQRPSPKCARTHSFGYHCDGTPRECFNCGRTGHISHECRAKGNGNNQPQQWVQKTPTYNGRFNQNLKPNVGAQGQGNSAQIQGNKGGNRGQVFALTHTQTEASPSVVQGNLAKFTTGQWVCLGAGAMGVLLVVVFKLAELHGSERLDSGIPLSEEERWNYWRSKVEHVKKRIQQKPVGDGSEA